MSAEERAAEVLAELGMCQFREDVNDGSMCLCGLPALNHDTVAAAIVLRDHPAIAGLLADRANAERDERLRALIAAIEDLYPPYNCELRYDGSEDPTAAAYVDAFREVDAALAPFRAALAAADPKIQP